MAIPVRICWFFIAWLWVGQVWAQRYEQTLEICERYYDEGEYQKALEKSEKLLSNLRKSRKGLLEAEAELYHAKYLEAMGQFGEFEDVIAKTLERKKYKGEATPLYTRALLDVATLYLIYSDVATATSFLESAKALIVEGQSDKDGNPPTQKWEDSFFQFQPLYIEAVVAMRRGEFDRFRELSPELLTLAEKRMTSKEVRFDRGTQKFEEQKLTAYEQRKRKRQYAELLTLRAENERRCGEYEQAYTYLNDAEMWIRDELGTKDLAFIANQHVRALLMIDRFEPEKDIRKMLEETLFLAERRLSPVHKLYLAIHETLIDQSIYFYHKKGKVAQWELRVNTSRYYGKDRMPHAISVRLDAKRDFFGGNYQAAAKALSELAQNENKVPINHQERIHVLRQLYQVALSNEDFAAAKQHLQQIMDVTSRIYGHQSLPYHETELLAANFYLSYTSQFAKADSLMRHGLDFMVGRVASQQVQYRQWMFQQAEYAEVAGQYAEAQSILQNTYQQTVKSLGPHHIQAAVCLEKLADLNLTMGNFKEANTQIDQLNQVMEQAKGQKAYAAKQAKALETSARYYAYMGLYEAAKLTLAKSERLFSRSVSPSANSSGVEELIDLYLNTDQFRQAALLIEEVRDTRHLRYGKDSRFLIKPTMQAAKLALLQGDFLVAQEESAQAADLAQRIFGSESIMLAEAWLLQADLQMALGDYTGAEELIRKAIDVQKKVFGPQHISLAVSYTKMANITMVSDGSASLPIEWMEQAKQIVSQNLGEDNPVYANTLQNLAKVYAWAKQLEDAERSLVQADGIWLQKLGTAINSNSAEIARQKGELAMLSGQYAQAISHFRTSQKTYQKIFGEQHPATVRAAAHLGRAYWMDQQAAKSKKITEQVLATYMEYVAEFFPALSDREKSKYWNLIREDFEFYYNLAFNSPKQSKKLLRNAYGYAMGTKSLLLSASMKTRNQILGSGDSTLIQLYNQWGQQKEELTQALSLSQEEIKEAGLDLKKMAKEIEDLEKTLAKLSDPFAQSQAQQVGWKEVREALSPDEAAVEIVRYRHFDGTFTDSVLYAAMAIETGAGAPKPVIFPKGKLMETNYLRYYRNSIIYNFEDENSYQYYWQPIADLLGKRKNVYLCTDGVYNQINLESIMTPNGDFVIDHANIKLMSNTRDLANRQDRDMAKSANNLVLFGNPVFYQELTNKEFDEYNDRAVTQLPSTLVEVRKLERLLKDQLSLSTVSFTHREATEDRVKALASPRVLHIATHGFFLPDEERKAGASEGLFAEQISNNPLLRSGLLFKDAGNLMASGNVFAYNKASGILTAYEAMSLNLDDTELVVLSACETGRGESKVGEGVYGLQRSLLVAGAETLIMSLFKVSDEATQELMELFYQNWLANGMDKREAFAKAKKTLRETRPDPIFWAAFVMIGAD